MWKRLLLVLALALILGCASPGKLKPISYDTIYDSLIIEIQPTNQCDMQPEILTKLLEYLHSNNFVNRKNIVVIKRPEIIVVNKIWTSDDITRLISHNRKVFDHNILDRHGAVFLLCMPGYYKSSDGNTDSVAALQRGDNEIYNRHQ